MSEEWRAIVGYEDYYEVSNCGSVRSLDREVEQAGPNGGMMSRKLRGKTIKAIPDSRGYPTVGLCRDGGCVRHRVHRLVLAEFVGECPDGEEACHNDGVRTNNCVSNLRWDTRSNNHKDKIKHGTDARGERSPNSRLSNEQAAAISLLYSQALATQKDLGKMFCVSPQTVGAIVRGNRYV